MYIVSLTYVKPIEMVEQYLPEHVEFLKRQYEQGLFLVSGRKVPRTGGLMIIRQMDRQLLDSILAQDPFYRQGIAEYQITEVNPTMMAPGLEPFFGAEA